VASVQFDPAVRKAWKGKGKKLDECGKRLLGKAQGMKGEKTRGGLEKIMRAVRKELFTVI